MLIRRRREDLQKEGLRGKGLIKGKVQGWENKKEERGMLQIQAGKLESYR